MEESHSSTYTTDSALSDVYWYMYSMGYISPYVACRVSRKYKVQPEVYNIVKYITPPDISHMNTFTTCVDFPRFALLIIDNNRSFATFKIVRTSIISCTLRCSYSAYNDIINREIFGTFGVTGLDVRWISLAAYNLHRHHINNSPITNIVAGMDSPSNIVIIYNISTVREIFTSRDTSEKYLEFAMREYLRRVRLVLTKDEYNKMF